MKNYLLPVFSLILLISCNRKEFVEYRTDLNSVKDDKLIIEYNCPEPGKDTVIFQFVKMAPGHSANYTNFGLYVSNIKAFDRDMNSLEVSRKDTNSFIISDASRLKRIVYHVDDTWDDTLHTKNNFASCVGTNFEQGENFVLNGGIFGYVRGTENQSLILELKHPESFEVSGKATYIEANNTNIYEFDSFSNLYDSPLLACKPDTSNFSINNIDFKVSVYNEQKLALASKFSELIIPKIQAVADFFANDLPPNRYEFMFYIKDASSIDSLLKAAGNFNEETVDRAIELYMGLNNYSQSALEHNNSSFFCMQADYSMQESFTMMDFIIHEFIHVFAPKSFNTELIRDFDFADPELSEHRWLYEGVTEYFSGIIKLRSGLISPDFYFNEILSQKLEMSSHFPAYFSFCEFSRYANRSTYKDHYHQSYYHGPVLALMLDLEIIRLSNGEKNLKDIFLTLYNSNIYLTEDNLIQNFVDAADPGLQEFFDRYISGTEELPFKELFNSAGIDYKKSAAGKVPDISIGAIPLFNYYLINRSNIEAIMPGDKLDINLFGRDGRKIFKNNDGQFVEEGDLVNMTLVRDKKDITVSFPARFSEGVLKNQLLINPSASEQEIRNRKKWIGI